MSGAGPAPTTVAAFDFDQTLTRRDSVVPFLRQVAGTLPLTGRLLASAHRVGPALARRDRDRLRALATREVFGGRPLDEVEQHAARFADTIVAERLRDDTVARLRWHREEGHRVVIVSASYEQYLRPVGERLGAEAVLGTRLEVVDGRCTGRLAGTNCRGPEKVTRLTTWLGDLGLDRSEVTLWAYGDSAGDRELLAHADHPVWVSGPLGSVAPTV